MTTIADLSRYDPVEAVDQYDGVILNVEDPGFAAKRDRANADGKPWGTYSWVYPGQGAAAAQRAHDAGTGPLGVWFDYEQSGVSLADLQAALARGDQLGLKTGVYTYLYIYNSIAGAIGDHPLWLAYYPGNNDGTYQDWYSNDARARGALLHQYTSSNGTRDLSRVLDDARWAQWTGGTGPAPQTDGSAEEIEIVYAEENGKYWADGLGDFYEVLPSVAIGVKLNGGALVPIKTAERIALGVSKKNQALAFLKAAKAAGVI